jgi:hypothetical protein
MLPKLKNFLFFKGKYDPNSYQQKGRSRRGAEDFLLEYNS